MTQRTETAEDLESQHRATGARGASGRQAPLAPSRGPAEDHQVRPRSASQAAPPVPRALGGFLLRHYGLLLVLLAAAATRALVILAYSPSFSFSDSSSYLQVAADGKPLLARPWGYSGFLYLLQHVVPFRGVAVVQHLLGLLVVVLLYAFLNSRGLHRSICCLAVAPVALDGYVLNIEHYVMAEALFSFLLAAGLAVLLWRPHTRGWAAAGAGLLMGGLAVTRTVGSFVILVVALYLLVRVVVRAAGWTAPVAFVLGAAVVVVPYASWFDNHNGEFAISGYTGHFLYGRVSNFVECDKINLPPGLDGLCPTGRPGERPFGDFYVWDVASPANSGRYTDEQLKQFALAAIYGQPLGFLATTASNTAHYFTSGRYFGRHDTCTAFWDFPQTQMTQGCAAILTTRGYGLKPVAHGVRPDLSRLAVSYQRRVHMPGPLLALCLLAAAAAALWPGGGRGAAHRLELLFLVAVGLTLLVVPSATAIFDYRYGLPTLVVLPVGAALAMSRWRGERSVARRGGNR